MKKAAAYLIRFVVIELVFAFIAMMAVISDRIPFWQAMAVLNVVGLALTLLIALITFLICLSYDLEE